MAALAFASAVAFVLLLLAPEGFQPVALVNAGTKFLDAAAAPPSLSVIREGDGYDGQFAYRLGLDPFTRERSAEGLTLDQPAYRHQRVLYPLLAWGLALGRSFPLPYALLAINLSAIAGLAWCVARYAQAHSRSPLWGLAVVAFPPMLISLAHDLPELLAATCVVGAMLALQTRRPGLAGGLLVLGVLAHEHTLAAVLAVALVAWASRGKTHGREWLSWLPPLLVFIGWQMLLTQNWGETPMRTAVSYMNMPLRGAAYGARQIIPPSNLGEALHLAAIVFLTVCSAAGAWGLRTTRSTGAVCLGWAFATLVLFLGGGQVWEAELWVWRTSALPLVLGACLLLGSRSPLVEPILVTSAALGLVMGARLIWMVWT